MKKLILLSLAIILGFYAIAQTSQNKLWSLPGSKLSFSTSPPTLTSLPHGPYNPLDIQYGDGIVYYDGYHGEPAENCHNAMHDINGNLLFFIVDDKVYDKDGWLIDHIFTWDVWVKGTAEIVIVPDPGNCQRYYIIAGGRSDYNGYANKTPYYAILDMSKPNAHFGAPHYGVLEHDPNDYSTAKSIAAITPAFQPEPVKQGGLFIAASKLRQDNSRLVFISNSYGIYRYKIDQSGFKYDNYVHSFGGSAFNQLTSRGEMELAELPDGTCRIAVPFMAEPNPLQINYTLFMVEFDPSGRPTENSITFTGSTSGDQWPYISGLEFSPDGNILYVTHGVTSTHPNPFEYFDYSNPGAGLQPLNVANANDFKSSQIELGKDGNLYLATSNRLATLSNPNTPDASSNWTNSALSIAYAANYEGMGSNYTSMKSYILPDQIDGMDYTAHFTVNQACCLINTQLHKDSYTAASGTWTSAANGNPLNNGGTVATIKTQLTIPAGVTVTITGMRLEFAPGAKLVIQPGNSSSAGGKLILNNTTLTAYSGCGANSMWKGVTVYGSPSLAQSSNQHGRLEMNNGSVIEHAEVGIVGNSGGIAQGINSTFQNNLYGVWFPSYSASGSLSKFTKCIFQNTAPLIDPSISFAKFALIQGIDGIIFTACIFRDTYNPVSNITERGIGIEAYNARFTVNSYCNQTVAYGQPCPDYSPSEFINLTTGVNAYSANGLKAMTADRCVFTDNYQGINLTGVNYATITRNIFNTQKTSYAYGVYLNGCTKYSVQENEFTQHESGLAFAVGDVRGIIVNNSGAGDNEVYNNRFHDLYVGGQAQGVNYSSVDPNYPVNAIGLRWKCNYFYNVISGADIALTSGGMAYLQGTCHPFNRVSPAGNRFSHNSFNNQNDLWVNSGALDYNYAHHADMITTPVRYNSALIKLDYCYDASSPVYYNQQASCPNKVGYSKIRLREAMNSAAMLIQDLTAKIDGGDTQKLLDYIQSNMAPPHVKSELQNRSPYLSDKVLIAAIERKNLAPDMLKEIILLNSPVSKEVMEKLENRMPKLPKKVFDDIKAAQTGTSERAMLEQEIAYHTGERNLAQDELVRYHLNDPALVNPIDSVIETLKEDSHTAAMEQLSSAYIINNNLDKADQVVEEIAGKKGRNNFYKMQKSLIKLRNEASVTDALNAQPELKVTVEEVAYDEEDKKTGVNALSLLKQAFNTDFELIIEDLYLAPTARKAGQIDENAIEENEISDEVKEIFTMYPNPANDVINFNYTLPIGKSAVIEVSNILGQKLNTHVVSENTNTFSLNTEVFNNGIYFVVFVIDGEEVSNQKLVINK